MNPGQMQMHKGLYLAETHLIARDKFIRCLGKILNPGIAHVPLA
jgi:hypothetical protein